MKNSKNNKNDILLNISKGTIRTIIGHEICNQARPLWTEYNESIYLSYGGENDKKWKNHLTIQNDKIGFTGYVHWNYNRSKKRLFLEKIILKITGCKSMEIHFFNTSVFEYINKTDSIFEEIIRIWILGEKHLIDDIPSKYGSYYKSMVVTNNISGFTCSVSKQKKIKQ